MLAKERQNYIVDTVNREGSVLVKELSEKFEVTEDSIRKDLSLLEKKGLLKKTYGGAVKNRVNSHDTYVSQRRGKNTEEKKAIARKAYQLIQEGDVIFLDISTTSIELIKLIVENNLRVTVVTNMIDVMLSFTSPAETNLLFLGGKLNRGRDGFIGAATNKQIEEYRFDKAFIGVVGLDAQKNKVYTYVIDDGITKKTIMDHSDKSYMMLETGKFEKDGNYKFATINDFNGIIMEKDPGKENGDSLSKYRIDLIY